MPAITVVNLPPNKGYEYRKAMFTLFTPAGTPCVGVLEVVETNGRKEQRRRYAVQEVLGADEGRSFMVTKPGGEDSYNVFMCVSPSQTAWDTCDCKAHSGRHECVHAQSIRRVVNRGGLPVASPKS